MRTYIYSDFNAYNPAKGNLTDLEAVEESVKNIIGTRPREMINVPDFALDLEDIIFDIIDDATGLAVTQRIDRVIRKYDPRVSVDYSKSQFFPDEDNNTLGLNLVINVTGLGSFELQANVIGG